MSGRARKQREFFAIATSALAVVVTVGIALSARKPLQFQVMSGKVSQGDHGLTFTSDDYRIDWRAGSQTGLGGALCSKNGAFTRYRDQWALTMYWRFEGALIPPPAVMPRFKTNALPCSIEVRRIIELRVIE